MTDMRIAIAGLGTIGRALARQLADGMPGLTLACVAARDEEKASGWLDEEGIEVPIVALDEFPGACRPRGRMRAGRDARADLPADAHRRQAGDGALLRRAAAAPRTCSSSRRQHGGRIIVPTGGLLGLDAVAAAAEGTIHSVKMTTRKPPNGLAGAPHLVKNAISVEGLNEPKLVFSGTRARCRGRLSRQRQRGRGARARRHRARPHHDRHLCGPDRHAELPRDRGRRRRGVASRCRSRTCRRKIRRPEKSSRSRSSRPCASSPRRCVSALSQASRPSRPRSRRNPARRFPPGRTGRRSPSCACRA